MSVASPSIDYRLSPLLTAASLDELYRASWPDPARSDRRAELDASLLWIAAYAGEKLVGLVRVVGDGGRHGFVIDTTVRPGYRRRGIARALLARARDAARARGVTWLHVDFEPHLEGLYRSAGFRHTEAGLMDLSGDGGTQPSDVATSDVPATTSRR